MTATPKILVVDDTEVLLKATARIMRNAGFKVLEADTGEAAIEIALAEMPDLALLDVDLPGISGIEVCRRFREEPRLKQVYVVMLSSTRVASEDQSEGLEFGADGYIARPIPNRELVARVKALLRLKKAEERLRRSEARLVEARKFEAVAKMSGGIAHDFNNLLAIIIGNIELARDVVPPKSEAGDNLDEAMKACFRARNLTHRFLGLSTAREPEKIKTDPRHLVRMAVDDMPLGEDIRLALDTDESLPRVFVDKEQMLEALQCLLENAVEAMPEGGVLSVALRSVAFENEAAIPDPLMTLGRYLAIEIGDTGCGIPSGSLPKIFDPYFSTKEMGIRKGMGLGLTAAYSAVLRHGGYLTVASEVGAGSRFTMYLPLSGDEDERREN